MTTSNSKYSEQDWELIAKIPQLTGLLMSTAAYSGVEGTKDELEASVRSIAEGKFKFPDNELINKIIPEGETLEEIMSNVRIQQKEMISKIDIDDDASLKRFQRETINAYKIVVYDISRVETGITLDQFRSWLLNIAEQVAIAAIEGTVFGKDADPFSDEERQIFSHIERNLTGRSSY